MRRRLGTGSAQTFGLRLSIGCMLGWAVGCGAAAERPGKPNSGHLPTLTIATFAGSVQDAQQTALTPLAEQSGLHFSLQGWDGSLATLQKRAQAGSTDWDLVLMQAAALQVACRQGLLLPQPLNRDPGSDAPDSSGSDCGVAALQMNLVLAWDKSRVDATPGWSDFWDVARRPGKRGLQRSPRGVLEIALMADGVAPEDVYRTLSGSGGIDRAFHKLDQLKPYIVWWTTPAEAVQIIESGAVLMTSATAAEITQADQTGHHFGTQWSQSLGLDVQWGAPRGTTPERQALVRSMLAVLSTPTARAAFLSACAASPVAVDPPKPTLMIDDRFWLDHLVPLVQRFDRWLDAK